MLYTGYAPTPARLDAKGLWCRLFTSRARDNTISFWRSRTSPLPLGGWITLAIVPPYDLPGAMSGVVESAPREKCILRQAEAGPVLRHAKIGSMYKSRTRSVCGDIALSQFVGIQILQLGQF